jgi:glycosyltransferase involved in cell wall biosynthesis
MTKICLVSFEIHPLTVGGCGVLLHHSARLLLSQGHEVIFLFDMDRKVFDNFVEAELPNYPNPQNCRAYHLETLIQGEGLPVSAFKTHYEYKSYQFYLAAGKVNKTEKPDLIEFFEYCGVAYYALNAKIAGLDFIDTHLTIRLHNSMELIDRQQPDNIHGLDRYVMYGLERHALRCAETVLYPSISYLNDEYLANYEPWFGSLKLSQPAILGHPVATGTSENPNGVLFYGRLFGFKGVDRFVDAAVLYLSDRENPRRDFYLVGYASNLAPTGSGTYKEYLIKKIPERFQPYFHFTGQISWQELGQLLPEILFAVVPSYIESFCYAAYELYQAGIPLIVTDIPAFKDPFKNEQNALVSNGTVGDLSRKITRLSLDDKLRDKIRTPYPIPVEALGDFYSSFPVRSWIQTKTPEISFGILICILVDEASRLQETLDSVNSASLELDRVILMRPAQNKQSGLHGENGGAAWFLGELYMIQDINGAPLIPAEIVTMDALLVLKAGDLVDQDFLQRCRSILNRQPEISFVASWKKRKTWRGWKLETHPLDAVPEIIPYLEPSLLNRVVMRTSPETLLIDLFDPRAGRFGEIGYLWQLESNSAAGLVIPEVMLSHSDKPAGGLDQKALDYLHLRDRNADRSARMKSFHLTLAKRDTVLRRFHYSTITIDPLIYRINLFIYALAASRFSKWLDSYPQIKRIPRGIVSRAYAALIKARSFFQQRL